MGALALHTTDTDLLDMLIDWTTAEELAGRMRRHPAHVARRLGALVAEGRVRECLVPRARGARGPRRVAYRDASQCPTWMDTPRGPGLAPPFHGSTARGRV